jgi:hypothetical protein
LLPYDWTSDPFRIRRLAGKVKKDQSTVTRELIARGWDYLMLRQYKEGKLSLGS